MTPWMIVSGQTFTARGNKCHIISLTCSAQAATCREMIPYYTAVEAIVTVMRWQHWAT